MGLNPKLKAREPKILVPGGTQGSGLPWICFQTQKWPYFDTYTLPEAEILGIRSFFRDLSFEQHPRPWKGAREPNIEVIEVSETKNSRLWTNKLDFDTYGLPGALVWGDRHYLTRLRVWEGSGPKIEGSGTKN